MRVGEWNVAKMSSQPGIEPATHSSGAFSAHVVCLNHLAITLPSFNPRFFCLSVSFNLVELALQKVSLCFKLSARQMVFETPTPFFRRHSWVFRNFFQNREFNRNAHFTRRAARCAEVRKYAGFQSLSKVFFFSLLHYLDNCFNRAKLQAFQETSPKCLSMMAGLAIKDSWRLLGMKLFSSVP